MRYIYNNYIDIEKQREFVVLNTESSTDNAVYMYLKRLCTICFIVGMLLNCFHK